MTTRCVRSSMDRVLPSEGRGCRFDPCRARQFSPFRFAQTDLAQRSRSCSHAVTAVTFGESQCARPVIWSPLSAPPSPEPYIGVVSRCGA